MDVDKKFSLHQNKFLNVLKPKQRLPSLLWLLERLKENENERTKFVKTYYSEMWDVFVTDLTTYQDSLLEIEGMDFIKDRKKVQAKFSESFVAQLLHVFSLLLDVVPDHINHADQFSFVVKLMGKLAYSKNKVEIRKQAIKYVFKLLELNYNTPSVNDLLELLMYFLDLSPFLSKIVVLVKLPYAHEKLPGIFPFRVLVVGHPSPTPSSPPHRLNSHSYSYVGVEGY
eukprot:TRINITY_DN11717_c0_g1_i1.p1 TRINITY_DN11717_c0_g1~~TRINITY_DN11717_c0_g1_i1.p1  ORF type:complete len:227 (-),score=38.63 TRINITY_DN11717_c0_g1_i1:488-1168(-)